MLLAISKTIVAAILISFVSWLAGKNTKLAGFLTALPLTTLLALGFSHLQWGDQKQSIDYAKSILLAIPFSLLFFIPFLISAKYQLGFWSCYIGGVALLSLGYFFYTYIAKII